MNARMSDAYQSARRMWALFEPYHAITYFAPECRAPFTQAGLRGFWMGYFAGRSAPMGPVGPGLVTATFYNFAPAMVARSLPDAWSFASVDAVLAARMEGVDRALTRVLGILTRSREVSEAAELAESAVRVTDACGRPLFAANADLSVPHEPHLRLWWALTCLREHRGDGHVAALLHAGLDGCEAHVMFVASGAIARSTLQPNRGWTDDEWALAAERLRSRGWIDESDALTDTGLSARRQLEQDTDRMAAEPWTKLGTERTVKLAELLAPVAREIASSGVIPVVNPIGLHAPSG
jgi:hypothetical protein